MSNNKMLSLKEVKNQFSTMLNSINKTDKKNFIEFVFEELACMEGGYFDDGSDGGSEKLEDGLLDDPVATLNKIADEIKKKVPINAILQSENIVTPNKGENADCAEDITVHVDDFLYTEDDIDDLVEDGKLQRNYCADCRSKNIHPLIFLSHSMSREALYYVFNTRLPTLENKTVLDIGSRLGAVLYGAFVYTDAPRIIGVEMNEDLCNLQNEMLRKYKMTDRVEVLHKRIEEAEDVVKSADIIIINNAFEFYVSEEEQIKIWQFLKSHIKSKTIMVLRPHLETTLLNINTGIVQEEWVKPYEPKEDVDGMLDAEEAAHCDISFYEVL